MAEYDKGELDAMSLVRLKKRRSLLRQLKQNIKRESHIVTPVVHSQLDNINREIRYISDTIFRICGERE